MHRSSDAIGAIAGALAKAQVELTNPEKSLAATFRARSLEESDRIFRYAPLSSGLEIVRKCLGRYGIAAMQTTMIDAHSGLIRLTTVLAHSSGEWVSSDWPVCTVSDTAVPHRMGAALTYARRYALFTLVGIAGEDDLDAPDFETPAIASNQDLGSDRGTTNGVALRRGDPLPFRSRRTVPEPILDAEQSAKRREAMLAEIERLGSAEDAATWAHGSLRTKNALATADAHTVEHAFAERLSSFDRAQPDTSPANETASPFGERESRAVPQKSIRQRDKEHRKFVSRQPCLVCGRTPSDPHHLRFAQPRAFGHRVSDEFTVPLCRTHHRELHRRGDEAAWWEAINIDPMRIALDLWQKTRLAQTAVPNISRA